MQTTVVNGRRRPTLSEQIERLDSILDGLADNLNEAVADAVKTAVAAAVQETVQAVLTEVLTNPTVAARFQAAVSSTPVEKSQADVSGPARLATTSFGGVWSWVCAQARSAGQTCVATLRAACQSGVACIQRIRAQARGAVRCVRTLSYCWRPFVLALGIGVALALSACLAGPWFAAVASGIAGFTTALAIQAGLWLQRVLQAVLSVVPERPERVEPAPCHSQ